MPKQVDGADERVPVRDACEDGSCPEGRIVCQHTCIPTDEDCFGRAERDQINESGSESSLIATIAIGTVAVVVIAVVIVAALIVGIRRRRSNLNGPKVDQGLRGPSSSPFENVTSNLYYGDCDRGQHVDFQVVSNNEYYEQTAPSNLASGVENNYYSQPSKVCKQ